MHLTRQTTAFALPMCPWALVSGATVFISVMGGYATFLGPMTGVMISDFILIRKQKMKLSSLVRVVLSTRVSPADAIVRVQPELQLLLLEGCQLAGSRSVGDRSRSALPGLPLHGLDGQD
jgi:hypothetical protein